MAEISISTPTSQPTSQPTQSATVDREVESRIREANARVNAAEKESNRAVSEIRDKFDKQYLNEGARHEAAFEAQRMKGYEQLRDLQTDQQKNLRETKSSGETDAAHLQEYYSRHFINTERNSREKLKETESQVFRELEHERKAGAEQEWMVKDKTDERLEQLRETGQDQLQKQETEGKQRIVDLTSRYQQETQRIGDNLESQFQGTQSKNEGMLKSIEDHATSEIDKIRKDTSEKLSAYSKRQEDPFYKMVSLNAKLKDEGNFYSLTATIPEYEQRHISSNMKGNNLVISGYRQTSEKVELDPGHSQGSSSYQTFSESFPLTWPVEASQLSRESQGDKIIIRVPKKNLVDVPVHSAGPRPEKARLEHPHLPNFPENLPTHSTGTPGPIQKSPGSGTLA